VVSKSKAQGTRFETAIVGTLQAVGFGTARRIAEGGSNDEGDIEFDDAAGEHWIIEAKATANLNVSQTLHKAKIKAPAYSNVAVVWKRLTRKSGNERRTPDGVPIVVVLDWQTYMDLVNRT